MSSPLFLEERPSTWFSCTRDAGGDVHQQAGLTSDQFHQTGVRSMYVASSCLQDGKKGCLATPTVEWILPGRMGGRVETRGKARMYEVSFRNHISRKNLERWGASLVATPHYVVHRERCTYPPPDSMSWWYRVISPSCADLRGVLVVLCARCVWLLGEGESATQRGEIRCASARLLVHFPPPKNTSHSPAILRDGDILLSEATMMQLSARAL